MRKFPFPFDAYELGSERPILIELHPQGPKRYMHLIDNPIYYFYGFNYVGGSFYRALFGYEALWDEDLENSHVDHLDAFLKRSAQQRDYYLEEISFAYRTKVWGISWPRRVKPVTNFNFRALQKKLVQRGERALARINCLDAPFHVDIEFSDGEIFSVSYQRYENWKNREQIRSLDHASTQPGKNSPNEKNGKFGKASKVKNFSCQNSLNPMASQLPPLRQRLRRSYSVSKARRQVF